MGKLARRRLQPEIMDQGDLAQQEHRQALVGLGRINWLSRSDGLLWPALAAVARTKRAQPLRVLDLATGGGDVPLRLWRRARKAGVALEIMGLDRSAVAIAHAQAEARRREAKVQFAVADVLHEALPEGYDVVMCSLFLHHLSEAQARELLRRMADAAREMLLVNDLVRGWTGWLLAQVGTRILTRSAVVHVDGPRSVEGAFTVDEVRALAEQAGLDEVSVSRRWPCRFLLRWRRS